MKTKYVYPSSVSLTSRLTVALVPPILAALQCCWPEMGARTAVFHGRRNGINLEGN